MDGLARPSPALPVDVLGEIVRMDADRPTEVTHGELACCPGLGIPVIALGLLVSIRFLQR
jgi:hypothetical protein